MKQSLLEDPKTLRNLPNLHFYRLRTVNQFLRYQGYVKEI